MTTRDEVAQASARVLERLGAKAVADPWATGLSIADELGLTAEVRHELGLSWLFVRDDDHVPPEVAARFDGVIVAQRVHRKGRVRLTNRDRDWYARVREAGTRIVLFDWMLPPGSWQPGLRAAVTFAKSVGAIGYCLNVEPRPKSYPYSRWEGNRREAARYAQATRDLCDEARLECWVTSWAKPSNRPSFPIREFVRFSHRDIPQPYEVHHAGGPKYVADVIAEWEEYGAKDILLGRGLHELDPSDSDALRTPEELAAHRTSTPAGMVEVWWPPRVDLERHPDLVDAMVAPLT